MKTRAARMAALAGLMAVVLQTTPAISATAADSGAWPTAAALGKRLFFDPSLSRSGRTSCASCHDPAHAYGPPNGLAAQFAGPEMNSQGARAVPSLRYVLNRTPVWHKTFIANPTERLLEGDESPVGGLGWDGRFDTLRAQAEFPLLAANEMANESPEEVAAKIQRAPYSDAFKKVFGAAVFGDPRQAYAKALFALERFELEDSSFRPFSSKYDDYLDGKAKLSEQELRGLKLFDDPKRGNCASCHLDRRGMDGSHPLFTSYQFEALGVPRNPEIAANADADYFDKGLCGPLRGDQAEQQQYCGMFKTPTLRNVAIRAVFFHNGRFHDLKESLRFYVRRDTNPRQWYPVSASGAVEKFDDLPPQLRANIDVIDEPLTRNEGSAPAWNEAEIDDVLSFLQTLTDRDARPASAGSLPISARK